MNDKYMNINNSDCKGNFIQGDVGGNVEANIKASSENQSSSENYNNDQRGANIANNANKLSDNAQQTTNQYHYWSEEKKTLAEAAKEIQDLIQQLQRTNPTATEQEMIEYVNDETNPRFKRRAFAALKAGGEAAIEEFLDNPYINVAKATIKGWIDLQ
jgi:hypothetical protein